MSAHQDNGAGLLECPCCGSKDVWIGNYSGASTAACRSCDLSIGGEESTLTADEIKLRWNRRTQPSALVEELEGLVVLMRTGNSQAQDDWADAISAILAKHRGEK